MYTLITAAASAKAYQVKNKIEGNEVLLGDYLELPEVMVTSGKMLRLPSPGQDTYPHLMLTLCLDKGITDVYLLRSEEASGLEPSKVLFEEYGIILHNLSNDKV